MDQSACLADPDLPPPSTVDNGQQRLVKPDNVKSRYWTHFLKYDAECHPDNKTLARCTLCGRDISVKQGTGGLKNHMKFKHPVENALLVSDDFNPDGEVCYQAENHSPTNDGEIEISSKGDTSTTIPITARRKKPRLENASAEIIERRDAEKRRIEKHLMEMWSLTRKEILQLRTELKNEVEDDIIRELESDLRVLQKRKANYAELLGFMKDEEDTTTCTERVESQARGRANVGTESRTTTTTPFEDFDVNADCAGETSYMD
ncbi:hypothetical protein ACHAXA_004955 [Cyclostephanos tholiformis]|uniref:BED-type domain-containing protein n=1 Tax=Cyclostephanos tholiformis TaxID=382380 RepID=A0ABD3RSA6_9STRA